MATAADPIVECASRADRPEFAAFAFRHFLCGGAPGERVLDEATYTATAALLGSGAYPDAMLRLGEESTTRDARGRAYIAVAGAALALAYDQFELAHELMIASVKVRPSEDEAVWRAVHGGILGVCLQAARIHPDHLRPFAPASEIAAESILRILQEYASFTEAALEMSILESKRDLLEVFSYASTALLYVIAPRPSRLGGLRRGFLRALAPESRAAYAQLREQASIPRARTLAEVVDGRTDTNWGFAATVERIEQAYDRAFDNLDPQYQ